MQATRTSQGAGEFHALRSKVQKQSEAMDLLALDLLPPPLQIHEGSCAVNTGGTVFLSNGEHRRGMGAGNIQAKPELLQEVSRACNGPGSCRFAWRPCPGAGPAPRHPPPLPLQPPSSE